MSMVPGLMYPGQCPDFWREKSNGNNSLRETLACVRASLPLPFRTPVDATTRMVFNAMTRERKCRLTADVYAVVNAA
jgi:hypothetical protein